MGETVTAKWHNVQQTPICIAWFINILYVKMVGFTVMLVIRSP